MAYRLHHGDAVRWARNYTGPLFHALFCDAPYEMAFMNKDWDGSGVAFNPETWEAFARVLYPGAFLFVFAGTINDDLISVAMREAGLRKFHKMMGWAYGSGFPKASRVDANIEKRRNDDIRHVCRFLRKKIEESGKSTKQIAKLFGFNPRMIDHWAARDTDSQPSVPTWDQWEILKRLLNFNGDMDSEVKRLNDRKGTYGEDWYRREVVGRATNGAGNTGDEIVKFMPPNSKEYDITKPATPLAQAFEGHRYGLQALKPAIETILVFQKSYEGKPIDNITETGSGVLNIEGGRIGTEEIPSNQWVDNAYPFGGGAGNEYKTTYNSGRWPSNFLLLDEGAAWALDEQSGITASGATKRNISAYEGESVTGFLRGISNSSNQHGDSGGASRFFFRVEEQIDEADPVRYMAKASGSERERGLFGIAPCIKCGGIDTKTHINEKGHEVECKRNSHTTVKPIALGEYLSTLLLPPIEYAPRRIFVPFAGVASEMIGALRAGWEEIDGVELTGEYIPIAEARLKYWESKPKGSRKPKSSVPENVKDPRQLEFK